LQELRHFSNKDSLLAEKPHLFAQLGLQEISIVLLLLLLILMSLLLLRISSLVCGSSIIVSIILSIAFIFSILSGKITVGFGDRTKYFNKGISLIVLLLNIPGIK